MSTETAQALGANSEVGQLRTVMVHRPDLAHERARARSWSGSLNPMFWPARQLETLNVEAIYRFHPRFRDAGVQIW